MRQASSVIYDANFGFEYGKGYTIKNSPDDVATIISSGRGVHEAIRAAQELEQIGIISSVVDMPSIDKDLLRDIYRSGTLMVIAEQNNGFILPGCREALSELAEPVDFTRLMSINTLDKSGLSQFIHSGTYDQLIRHFGLASDQIAERIRLRVAR
jgi:transketolase